MDKEYALFLPFPIERENVTGRQEILFFDNTVRSRWIFLQSSGIIPF